LSITPIAQRELLKTVFATVALSDLVSTAPSFDGLLLVDAAKSHQSAPSKQLSLSSTHHKTHPTQRTALPHNTKHSIHHNILSTSTQYHLSIPIDFAKKHISAMSEEWEAVTKIGSKVRAGGSGVAKDKVIRGESALNAARRQGADIATEKKFGGTNSVRCHSLPTSPLL
jgi:hypothetical protein